MLLGPIHPELPSPLVSKHKARQVRILNPHPGKASHTTRRRADDMVERRIAVWKGPALEILPECWTRHLRRIDAQQWDRQKTDADIDREIILNRNGVCYWNGRDANGAHLPGAVRS